MRPTLPPRMSLAAFALVILAAVAACGPPKDPRRFGPLPEEDHHAYYLETYDEARAAFRAEAAALAERYERVEIGSIPVPSDSAAGLTIDWALVPAQEARGRLLIVTSGLHGAEGLAASAVQRHFMARMLPQADLGDLSVLLIHSINAWGVNAFRRVTEHNVDLNRNFDTTDALYQGINEGYRTIEGLLNPTGPVKLASPTHRFFRMRAVAAIARHGMPALRQAALQGQYEYPKGIYFGGQGPEPHRDLLEPVMRAAAEGCDPVMIIDLHTGYGERGKLHLFPNPPRSEAIRAATEHVYEGMTIDWGDTGDFYTTTGEFTGWVGKILPEAVTFVPMTFEYGTLDSQTTSGALESIHRTILENQGAQFGYARDKDEAKVKALYREMFFPSSPHWRAKIIEDSAQVWPGVLARFGELEPGAGAAADPQGP